MWTKLFTGVKKNAFRRKLKVRNQRLFFKSRDDPDCHDSTTKAGSNIPLAFQPPLATSWETDTCVYACHASAVVMWAISVSSLTTVSVPLTQTQCPLDKGSRLAAVGQWAAKCKALHYTGWQGWTRAITHSFASLTLGCLTVAIWPHIPEHVGGNTTQPVRNNLPWILLGDLESRIRHLVTVIDSDIWSWLPRLPCQISLPFLWSCFSDSLPPPQSPLPLSDIHV